MTDQIDLDRLAGLERAATDGPWVAEVWPVVRSMRAGRRTEGEVSVISSDGLYGVMEGPDAEFIAEMRNAAPALIERVKTAEAERDALAAKIEQVRALASANNRLRDSENACMLYAPSILAILDQNKEGTRE